MKTSRRTKISLSEIRGVILVVIGILALLFYYSWWLQSGRLMSPLFVVGFIGALFYGIMQLLANWLVYLGTHHRPAVSAPQPTELTVDILVTAYKEDPALIKRALMAVCNMHGKYQAWLLDDGDDPELAQIAKQFGVGYLTRSGNKEAKAGNINAALPQLKGDIVVIFDIDHIPDPSFLERTLGSFTDPAVGFVQVMPTFSNNREGWVARAATETTFDFYNPTSRGMDGFKSVTKMGTNSLIRRSALDSIGGYQPGLAEDLATSIALHAAGWESRYVAEPLAPGLAPPDLTAWFTQQLKWARGVFEVAIVAYPRLFKRLTWGQRLSYSVRMTNYLLGPVIFVHMAALIMVLLSGSHLAHAALQQYFIYLTPLAIMDMLIRQLALRKWRHASISASLMWRATILVFNTWPLYTLAWILAGLRLPLSFRPTPKNKAGNVKLLWLLPQLISIVLLVGGVIYSLTVVAESTSFYLLYGIAICFVIPQLGLLRPLLRPIVTKNKTALVVEDKVHVSSTVIDDEKTSMADKIKVLDIELSRPLEDIENLDEYIKLKGLVRWHGTPLGYIELPIMNGCCTATAISKSILAQHNWSIIRELLNNRLISSPLPDQLQISDLLKIPPPTFAESFPLVTVAVCTRDRTDDLALCLEALIKLDYSNFEILVVDNAPSNDTTEKLIARHYPTVRYICEPRPGLDWARNRAILEAKGEIIAYTDDDVIVDQGWVAALAAIFVENPEVMAVTGLVVPFELETEAQLLFELYGGFGRGFERKWHRVDETSQYKWVYHGSGQFGTGANMAYRRCVFEQIGYFDPALDVGTVTNGGGDLEMFFRVLKEGHTLVYEPRAMIRHRHRRDYAKLHTQIRNNGIGFYAYLVRSALAYPEERKTITWLGVWWFWWWSIRRLLGSLLLPGRFPRDLILSELKGSFVGLSRYQKARSTAASIADKYSDQPRPSLAPPQKKQSPSGPKHQYAIGVRTVDLAQPLSPLTDLDNYHITRIFVSWGNDLLGSVDIVNQAQSISITRLCQEIVNNMALKLLEPHDQVGQGRTWSDIENVLSNYLVPPQEEIKTNLASPLPADVSVSVVIATFDRSSDLRECLQSLVTQQTSRSVEIIVVDNNPTSGLTPPVVAEFPNVILLQEHRPGLSYARNTGIVASTGEIVVATDDDVLIPPNWLEKLVAPFTRADVMIVTGNVLPFELSTQGQQLFEQYGGLGRGFERFEANSEWFEKHKYYPAPTWKLGATANAAFRSSIFHHPEIGLMVEELGAGSPTGCSEDTFIFYQVLKLGYTLVYEPTAFVWHKHRRTIEALRRQIYSYSKGHVAYHLLTLLHHKDLRALFHITGHLPLWHTRQLVWKLKERLRGRINEYPISFTLLEVAGNLAGPWALWQSWRRVKSIGRSDPYIPLEERIDDLLTNNNKQFDHARSNGSNSLPVSKIARHPNNIL